MDALGIMHPLHIPRLPPKRLRRWCERRTAMEVERARRRGRAISGANARRMLARRYEAAAATRSASS